MYKILKKYNKSFYVMKKTKLKVLMIGWGLPPNIEGGLDIHVYSIAKEIAKRKHKVYLVVPYFNEVQIDEKNIEVIGVRCRKTGNDVFGVVKDYNRKTVKQVGDLDFNVIHTHDWFSGLAGFMLRDITKKPWVNTMHSLEYMRAGVCRCNKIIEDIEEFIVRHADMNIAVSKLVRDGMAEMYNLKKRGIRVIYNGACLDFKGKMNKKEAKKELGIDGPAVLSVSRISNQKNLQLLIYAFKKVLERKRVKNVRLIIIGRGFMRKSLERLCKSLAIEEFVEFKGFVSNEVLIKYYAAAEVFVLPSFYEPFGIAVLDAINLKVPVIMSNKCGIGEVMEADKEVIKFDPLKSDELVNAIESLLLNREKGEAMARLAYEKAKLFSWRKSANKVLNIYKEVIKNKCR